MYAGITPDYYGYRDEDRSGAPAAAAGLGLELLELERGRELLLRGEAEREYAVRKRRRVEELVRSGGLLGGSDSDADGDGDGDVDGDVDALEEFDAEMRRLRGEPAPETDTEPVGEAEAAV